VVPEAKRFTIATKSDDAEVPEHLWDQRALRVNGTPTFQEGKALTMLRKVLLKCWRNITNRSFLNYLNLKPFIPGIVKQDDGKYGWVTSGRNTYYTWWHGSPRARNQDVEIGRDCVQRICDSSWWNWDGGSTPFFWRWPSEFRTHMRDGTPLWFDSTLAPSYIMPQRAERNPTLKDRVKEKLDKILKQIYFEVGLVNSLITFFGVPKGEDDMRVVYDGSLPGLNAALWCPWFMLPNTNSHLRTVEPGTFMSDVDIDEMFLNFFLDWHLRKYAAVDLTSYFDDDLGKGKYTFWVRWSRIAMGIMPFPFCAVQIMAWLDETVFGDHLDQDNVFWWDVVELNLPGMPSYSPSKPWV
jgi:hypothetical protein